MRHTSKLTLVVSLVGLAASQFSSIAGAQAPPLPGPGAPDPIVASRQEHARLGVALSDNTQGKVWIKSIEPSSAADEAGLRPNDQILALDDTKINTYLDVVRYINQKGASDDVAVYIRRNGRPGMLTAALGSQYAGPTGGEVAEYPGNVRQRSYSSPALPTAPQRAPGFAVPNTRGPYNR